VSSPGFSSCFTKAKFRPGLAHRKSVLGNDLREQEVETGKHKAEDK
jgi:hypothetical protein